MKKYLAYGTLDCADGARIEDGAEVYLADEVDEAIAAKDARITELENVNRRRALDFAPSSAEGQPDDWRVLAR